MNEKLIEEMVSRFLSWKLPQHFSPDAGIKFEPFYQYKADGAAHEWPVGTNLFNASQAEEMVRYMLDGLVVECADCEVKGGQVSLLRQKLAAAQEALLDVGVAVGRGYQSAFLKSEQS